ncbi:MAG TPA: shikimate dehydrogenase [Chloroflexi bacterium]|nr:shikimate dehydrogenase [Chloroflexota bacterium]
MPSPRTFYALGLLGYPLSHSRSPELHRGFLRRCGLAGEYRLYEVPPGHPEALRAHLEALRREEIHGLNVTIPHKQRVLPWLDDFTPAAAAIGAVNTLWADHGRLWGDNTDAPGFLHDLQAHFGAWATRPHRALVLGAGGAARAVTYALLQAGWEVTVAARQPAQAATLCAALKAAASHPSGALCRPLPWAQRATLLPPPDLIVNATPLGMAPRAETSPWPSAAAFPPQARVYDLVYNPAETRLLQQARAAGLAAANGWGMLVAQAALAFRRWTGCAPLVDNLPQKP